MSGGSGTTSVFSFTTGADVLLVVSNLAFLIPAITACWLYRNSPSPRLHRRVLMLIAAANYLGILLASSTYHLCNSFSATCLFEAATHKSIDFFFAQLVIPLSAILVIHVPPKWEALDWWWMIIFATLLFVLEITIGEGFIVQMALALSCFVVVAIYWAGYAIYTKEKLGHALFPAYDWENFVLAIALTFMAVSLFATQMQWHSGYWAIHSTWHVLGALGQYFLLGIYLPLRAAKTVIVTLEDVVRHGALYMKDTAPGSAVVDVMESLGLLEEGRAGSKAISHVTPASLF